MPSDFYKNQVLALCGAPNPPQIGPAAILKWWRHHEIFYIEHDYFNTMNKLCKFQLHIFFQSKVISILNFGHFVLREVTNSHLVLTNWA